MFCNIQRQPTSKQRILDAETNNLTEQCGITLVEDIAFNGIGDFLKIGKLNTYVGPGLLIIGFRPCNDPGIFLVML